MNRPSALLAKETVVKSMSDYTKAISLIAAPADTEPQYKCTNPKILWFRGMDYADHPLIPSLYRLKDSAGDGSGCLAYSQYPPFRYAEDLRTQHYIAKNYHFFSKLPASRVEWLEVMQHHLTKTRVMDWSESSIHSLMFAVEAFLDNRDFNYEVRKKQAPCVWVLEPQELNGRIFKRILCAEPLCKDLFEELDLDEQTVQSVLSKCENVLDQYTRSYRNDSTSVKGTGHLENIVNLSTINDEIFRDRSRLKYRLINGEIFPLFYLLSRIYSDGYILEDRSLPPLAVVQPYHSERIKAQRGVFTVFPFYQEKEGDSMLRSMGIELNAMQYNEDAKGCLHKIVLQDPERIACELLANGIKRSWLYPELPIVSNEIEGRKIY